MKNRHFGRKHICPTGSGLLWNWHEQSNLRAFPQASCDAWVTIFKSTLGDFSLRLHSKTIFMLVLGGQQETNKITLEQWDACSIFFGSRFFTHLLVGFLSARVGKPSHPIFQGGRHLAVQREVTKRDPSPPRQGEEEGWKAFSEPVFSQQWQRHFQLACQPHQHHHTNMFLITALWELSRKTLVS